MSDRIQPPFMLFTLHAEPGIRNSPGDPAVYLMHCDLADGRVLTSDVITPDQARQLARQLTLSADEADRRFAARPNSGGER